MAKNRREPEKSVDSEEEDFSSDESGGSDSEPELPLSQVSKKPSSFSSNKPIPSSQSKHSDAGPSSPTKSVAGSKRPAAAGEAKESKRSKKKQNAEIGSSAKNSLTEDSKKKPIAEVGSSKKLIAKVGSLKKPIAEVGSSAKKPLTEDSKKQLFQRLWSEEDEITILKGMIEYAAEMNADPVADLTAFHDFIRKSLLLDATRTQLQDKIRRLRKKYENNVGKEKKGKERTFSKSHEQNAYDLSKKIWGSHKTQNGSVAAAEGDQVMDGANTNMDVEKNVEGSKTRSLGGGSLFGKSLNELVEWIKIEKNKLVGISEEKLGKLEEKWKSLRVAELQLFLKKTELIHEQGVMVLDALK